MVAKRAGGADEIGGGEGTRARAMRAREDMGP